MDRRKQTAKPELIPARHVAERVHVVRVLKWGGGSVMAKAWVRKRLFNDKPHFYVEFRFRGKRRQKSYGPGANAHRLAKAEAIKLDAELRTGKYEERECEREQQAAEEARHMTWAQFVEEYDAKEVRLMPSERSKPSVRKSLKFFGEICNNPMLHEITSGKIMEFRATRSTARGKKRGSTISPATVNSDLRCIKAALRAAADWGHIDRAPKFKFLDESREFKRYITPEHFAAIYKACDSATLPDEMHVPAGQWWRAVLMFVSMTGWRIGATLALKWADVDLEAGTALTRAKDNKSKRDAVVALHPAVIEHVRPLKTFHPNVFPWEHDRTCLMNHFHKIQAAAGVNLPCRITEPHECTDRCHRYGFHDGRRMFATMNATNMTREALQELMQHASPLTTAVYIGFARQMKPAVANLYVPNVG
jgi:integrase